MRRGKIIPQGGVINRGRKMRGARKIYYKGGYCA